LGGQPSRIEQQPMLIERGQEHPVACHYADDEAVV